MNVSLGFSRDKSLKSRLIRWVIKSNYSHVFIRYESHHWGDVVVHATDRGIVVEPFERITKNKTIELFELNHDMTKGFANVRQHLTARYDFRSVIWNALLYLLLRITNAQFLWKLVARNAARLSCSEFGVLWLQGAAFPKSNNLDTELTHLGILYGFITKSNLCKLQQ